MSMSPFAGHVITDEEYDAYYFAPIRAKLGKLNAEHPDSRFFKVFTEAAEETMMRFKEAGYPVSNSMTETLRTAAIESRMLHLRVMMDRV